PCAEALDRNQRLIDCAENAVGANLVVADKPTGDKHNSLSTTIKKLNNSHQGLAKVSVPLCIIAGMTIITKDNPPNIRPNANFLLVERCLTPNFIHTDANTGASKMMNNGYSDRNLDDLISQPIKLNSVGLFA